MVTLLVTMTASHSEISYMGITFIQENHVHTIICNECKLGMQLIILASESEDITFVESDVSQM